MTSHVRHREFRFPVEVDWDQGRRTTARVDGKAPLGIATPPEFRGTDPDVWSPEDALVAAAGSCLAVTIVALAERRNVVLRTLSVSANGVVGRRPDGRFGFVRLEQTVRIEADAEDEAVRELVRTAHDGCLVTASLDVPVETVIELPARATS